MTATEELAESLLRHLRGIGPLAVAYSGRRRLRSRPRRRRPGPRDRPACWPSPPSPTAWPPGNWTPPAPSPSGLGVRHLAVSSRELDRPGYRANGRDRCYFCKSEVLDTLAHAARGHGYDQLATGTNADDAADPHRPGIGAGRERGVRTPLLDAGLTKARRARGQPSLVAAHLGQARHPVPGQPHPLRPRSHPLRASPASTARRPPSAPSSPAPGSPSPTCASATSATPPESRSQHP